MSTGADYLETLQAAILIKHGCKPTHKDTIFVREKTNDDEIVWEGHVEVFDLTGHHEAKTCYAWQHKDSQANVKIFAVLESKLITSPVRAVQAALFAGIQPPLLPNVKLLKTQLKESRQLLHESEIKSEDWDATIQAAKAIKENLKQNRPTPD